MQWEGNATDGAEGNAPIKTVGGTVKIATEKVWRPMSAKWTEKREAGPRVQ